MEFAKLIKLISACGVLVCGQAAYAGVSIESGSLSWDNVSARDKLLASAPAWPSTAIKSVFQEYLHPERHHLPPFINGTRPDYNALFINSFWGFKDNPFVKYPRPAKVFIFVNDGSNAKKYYMAPVVRDKSSNDYYVYDKAQPQPTLLKDWVAGKSNGFHYPVNINVCNGYGVAPRDTCDGNSYEGEIYTYPQITVADLPSAKRVRGQDWHDAMERNRPANAPAGDNILDGSSSWEDVAKRMALLRTVETWPTYKIIKKNYKKIRDYRYFVDNTDAGFMRRITWLFPDDGCYSRIAAINKDFFGPLGNIVNKFTRPSKIFAYGNLCVNTANHPDGSVMWWYHVAPIVRDAKTNRTYVLDPSINPNAPMPVERWIAAISAKDGACASFPGSVTTFSICNGYGLSPYDKCELSSEVSFESEIRGMLLQKAFRKLEKDRQVELGRNPDKVLGDSPPWKSQ